jgi:hypothetical protein
MIALPHSLRAWAALGLGAALALGGGGGCGDSECGDGADNDADGFIDSADPGCFEGAAESPDPVLGGCNDHVDNDGDGKIDLEDFGCDDEEDAEEYNEPIAACRDGIDNDGDGLLDFPNDPGCIVSPDDDEADDCPNGATCPACSNAADDDRDDVSDYPDDLGCNSASDLDEFNADPSICGANVQLQPLPDDGVVNGFIDPEGGNELISFDCGGSGRESVFIIYVDEPIALEATTVFDDTEVDTVLYLRSMCREQDTELGCNDDATADDVSSRLSIDRLEIGEYYLVVDARNAGSGGAFRLEVSRYLAAGGECDPADTTTTCPPGHVCRLLAPDAAGETCELPQCSDGGDFDGDGDDGYPDDPGCEGPEDNDEADDCPNGATCPQCADGDDNNDPEDSLVDYPADAGCSSAADNSENDCTDTDPLLVLTTTHVTGNTTNLTDDFDLSCTSQSASKDRAYSLTIPGNLTSLKVDTAGSALDTVIAIRADECTSVDLECNDEGGFPDFEFGESAFELTNVDAGLYFIIVDGWLGANGAYDLNVKGVIKTGQPCIAAQVTNGLWSCQGGGACSGGTCQ